MFEGSKSHNFRTKRDLTNYLLSVLSSIPLESILVRSGQGLTAESQGQEKYLVNSAESKLRPSVHCRTAKVDC